MRLHELPAHKLHRMLKAKEITSLELTEAVISRLDQVEPKLKAFITLIPEEAQQAARQIDDRIAKGEALAPLAGIPVAIKDNMCLKGVRTTCASRILHNYVPPYTATVVERLLTQGAVVVGKTNMDEFAFGSSTENSAFGGTRNPWDISRVPGGSSGGSASAVAAGAAVVALGSDTGGSIRQPASLCGVAGLKPTYGRVSRYGLVAFASSLDQIGPFGRDVTDCALVLQAIAGHDPMDSTSSPENVPNYMEELEKGVSGLRIGVPSELMGEGLQPAVRSAVDEAIRIFESLGAQVDELSLPYVGYSIPTYYLIAPSEASSNLARFDGVRYAYRAQDFTDVVEMYKKTRGEGFGKEAKRRIMLGTYALSAGYYQAFYGQAQKVRTLIIRDFEQAFAKYDFLISPTSPTTAFGLGEKLDDPLQMYLSDVCTAPINLAGLPAISIPCGLADGLPVGLQIIGKHLDESMVLRAARAFESAFENIGLPAVA